MYMPRTGRSVLFISRDCLRQELPSDFGSAAWVGEMKSDLQAVKNKDQTASYSATDSTSTEMRRWIREGSHRRVRMVSHSRVKD